MSKTFEIKVNNQELNKSSFINAIKKTRFGEWIDEALYKRKIKRQADIIRKLSDNIVNNIKKNQLSGQKLNKVTGALQNSIKSRMIASNGRITAEVYTNYRLAIMYEDGYNGVIKVKEHFEKRNKVFNRSTPTYNRFVPAHTRRVNFKARNFMKEEFEKSRQDIIDKITLSMLK